MFIFQALVWSVPQLHGAGLLVPDGSQFPWYILPFFKPKQLLILLSVN